MMKKSLATILSSLLIVVLMLSLIGCTWGGNEESGETDVFARPLNFICTAGAGGDTDFNSRLLAEYLEKTYNQTIVCSNVTGGNGAVALTLYKDKKPDNQTFILTNSSVLSGNYATGLMDFAYDAYDPVAIYGISSGEVILVPADSPYQSLGDLVAASQAKPNTIIYGGPTGGASYLACFLALSAEYKAQMAFVEAGDGAERLASMLGGHLDVCNSALLNCKDYIDSGKLRPLATLLSKTPSAYPDIPVASDEYPLMVQDTYYVLLALKGTSPKIIEQLNAAVADVVNNNAEYRAEYYKMNLQNAYSMSVEETVEALEQQKNHFVELAKLMNQTGDK